MEKSSLSAVSTPSSLLAHRRRQDVVRQLITFHPLTGRMASAWKDTPTKWYPIPIALGAAVLLAVQYRKSSPRISSVNDRIEVTGDGEQGAHVQVKSGPWQFRVLGALPLRSLSQLWGYLNGLVLPVWFRPFGFKLYARIFGCNLEECEEQDLTKFDSLGEFFYRTLKPGVRPIDTSAEVVSPRLVPLCGCAHVRPCRLHRSVPRTERSCILVKSTANG